MKRSLAMGSANGRNGPLRKRPYPELPASTLRYLGASLKQQWKRYRRGLKRCQQKFSEKAVHESRVETRRLLSILELLRPFLSAGRFQKAQAYLKEHLDTFDDLRDTQVQLTSVGKMRRTFPAARPFHAYLEKQEDRFARQTRKDIKRIKTKRLGKLIVAGREDVKNWCSRAGPGKANAMLIGSINHSFTRTLSLRNRINPKDAATIHCTRVAFKRLRYMIETLADYFPRANEKLLDAMHRYQTMMGDIQDAEVLRQSVERFLEKEKMKTSDARHFLRELLARREFLIRVYLDAADQLLDFWPEPSTPAGKRGNGVIPSPSGARTTSRSISASPEQKSK
jgi:CHAD domain-containing protein